jgi:hypothetical protein
MGQVKNISTVLALMVAGLLVGVGCMGEVGEPIDDDTEGADVAMEDPGLSTQVNKRAPGQTTNPNDPKQGNKPPGQTTNPNPGK